jgi:uncharacterized membrane protein
MKFTGQYPYVIYTKITNRTAGDICLASSPERCLPPDPESQRMNDQADPTEPQHGLTPWLWRRRRTRLGVSAAIGSVATGLTVALGNWQYAPSVGWDATAIVFCGTVWLGVWPLSAELTAARATGEDPSRTTSDVLTLGASVASLVAVGIVLAAGHAAHDVERGLLAGLGLGTVAVSWFTVHTIFTLRYATLYYTGPRGGIDFNSPELPSYRDFAYIALTLGMTFQVSDTSLQTTQMRETALRHSLLSYLFGSVILATAINLVAGLGS